MKSMADRIKTNKSIEPSRLQLASYVLAHIFFLGAIIIYPKITGYENDFKSSDGNGIEFTVPRDYSAIFFPLLAIIFTGCLSCMAFS